MQEDLLARQPSLQRSLYRGLLLRENNRIEILHVSSKLIVQSPGEEPVSRQKGKI